MCNGNSRMPRTLVPYEHNSTVFEFLTKYDPDLSRSRRLNYGLNKDSIKICYDHFIQPIIFFFSVLICFLCKSTLCEWIECQIWLDKWFMHKYLTLINITKCPWISVKFRIVEIIYAITIKWYHPDIFRA